LFSIAISTFSCLLTVGGFEKELGLFTRGYCEFRPFLQEGTVTMLISRSILNIYIYIKIIFYFIFNINILKLLKNINFKIFYLFLKLT
jgi:hypothetical protein